MTVILTLSNSDDWERIVSKTPTQNVRHISDASKADGGCIVRQPASMDDLRSTLTTCESVLLVYPSIESVLSAEMKSGASEETAVSKGINFGEELLTIHKGARRKLKLVNMRHLSVATEDELQALSEHGWDISGSPEIAPDDVFVLAALQLIKQNKKLNKCTELLSASSIPLSQSAGDVDIDSILNGYKTLAVDVEKSRQSEEDKLHQISDLKHELSQKVGNVHAMQNERDLLQSQLIQVQEELEAYYTQSEELKASLQREKVTATQSERKAQDAVQELQRLNAAQVEDLNSLKLALANKESLANDLWEQVHDGLAKIEALLNEREDDKNTLSERSALLKSFEAQAEERSKENELLKAHLITVQEELEKYFVNASNAEEHLTTELEQRNALQNELSISQKKLQQLTSENATLESRLLRVEDAKRQQHSAHIRELKQQQREYTKLEHKFKQQRGELASHTQQVKRLENELENIKKSGSWKIGAPARAVGRALSKVDKKKHKLQQDIGLLYTSDLFDADWYLKTYPDIAEAGVDPAEHYLKYGAEEGRLPSAYFDGNWYLQRYPDIADSKVNPLIHYLKFGQNEGRTGSPKLLENSAE